MKDLISIIIPVYNVEKYINRCIDSILKQTYKNIEVILVDDGSTDNSGKICDEYSEKDKRIKVIHKQNGGQSEARNYALDIFEGEYVTFLDSDDYVSEDYIEYMYNLLINTKTEMSICAVQIVNDDKKMYNIEQTKIEIYNKKEAFENLLYSEGVEVAVYAKLYPRKYFDEIRFPVGEKYEDIAIIAELMNKAEKISYGDKKCYFYYTRPGSTSKSGFNKNELDYIKNVKRMLDFIKSNLTGVEEAILRYRIYSKFRILRIMLFSENKDKKLQAEIIKEIKCDYNKILKDPRAPKRDKIAVLTLKMGLPIFKMSWYLYSKMTRRVL